VLAILASVARSLRLRVAPRALLPFAARVGEVLMRSMGQRVPPAGSRDSGRSSARSP